MTMRERFDSKWMPEPNTGCWLWIAYAHANGYGQFNVTATQPRRAHRVAYELYVGPIPAGLCACHRCDTPLCVNPDHLFLGTHRDNVADKMAKGRGGDRRGEASGRARLTEAQVLQVMALCRGGATRASVAARFGVASGTIRSIVKGLTWSHVTGGEAL